MIAAQPPAARPGPPTRTAPAAARTPSGDRAWLRRSLRTSGIDLGPVIGRGATCLVHAATDADGRAVVVKVARRPTPSTSAALRHEARVLRRLHGRPGAAVVPQVVRILDQHEGLALVLGPRGDETLDAWAARRPVPVEARAVVAMAYELVAALASIHAGGVVHTDVSPSNVVLCGDHVLVIDLAAAVIDGARAVGPCGTLPYAAPEVIAGGPVDGTTDLFALARIVIELVLGRDGAVGPEPEVRAGLAAEGLDDALVAVVCAALAEHPNERPGHDAWLDALAASAAIATCDEGGTADDAVAPARPTSARDDGISSVRTRPFGPRPPGRFPPPPASSHSRRAAAVIAGAAAMLIGGALVTARTASDEGPRSAPSPPATTTSTASNDPVTAAAALPADDPRGAPPPELLRWDPATAEALVTTAQGVRRYRIGQPGDQLVAGRWGCAGEIRPAVYRPTTGDLFTFRSWATDREAVPSMTVEHGHAIGGTLRRSLDEGCDAITIEPPVGAGPAVAPVAPVAPAAPAARETAPAGPPSAAPRE